MTQRLAFHEHIDVLPATLIHGEPVTDKEFLCETHGARLTLVDGALACPECDAESIEAEIDEHRDYLASLPKEPDFTGFACVMPWWA